MKNEDYIDLSRDWYYVQAFSQASKKWIHIIVFAKTKKEAMGKIDKWLYENDAHNNNLYLYRNNYKPDARLLVREGKVIK